MTKDTFGVSLKREREMRGVTLEEVSGATRIATRFLKAIEDEQWDQLPGGVFNRGFVRAVARYLGLDEENIVAEYTLAVGDRQTVPVWTGSPPAVTPDTPWLAWVIGAILVAALLAGTWFGTRKILERRAAKRAAQAASLSATSATPVAAPAQEPAPPAAAPPAADAPDAPSAGSGAAAAAADSAPLTSSGSSVPQLFELKIVSDKKTKVMVVADKDIVYDGNMKPGENHFFQAVDHFQITAKDAGVVHLQLNGKALAPLGPAGHSGKITLTRDMMKGVPGGAN